MIIRNKTSIFGTYALVSMLGVIGFWWFGAKSGESVTALNAFLAIYSFVSTTIVFYVLASQKQSIDNATDSIFNESQERSRDIESAYRYIDGEGEKVSRRLDAQENNFYRELERIERDVDSYKTGDCCKAVN